ncbi:L,D-transpeptidase [uncultured Alsobacter sp.]|uniref:L,D-transpeptidase family protein n=1 Tax=uncultured Alsobacter sp. TaxID=1748258 RepID=UPI0025D8BAF0|nr:L,D-transpeptidase [uncultured Alsobacter sp.]
MRRRSLFALAIGVATVALPAAAREASTPRQARLDARAINAAAWTGRGTRAADPALIRAEVMLDRLRFSPGQIDGRGGDNVDRAVAAYQKAQGLAETGKLDRATFDRLTTGGPDAVVSYRIGKDDVAGPFTASIPSGVENQAKLKRLGYRNAAEALAERFHMDERLLRTLNPGARFEAGEDILVANTARGPEDQKAERVEVDKGKRRVRVLGGNGILLATFPASIGSEEKPAPSGSFAVKGVARNPTWTYNPKFAFREVKAKRVLKLPPGPNNPVGAVWIDLTAETYGIHGTPEPRMIGRSFSHGCVRLTNWDALDLASLVKPGTPVDFIE